MSQNTKGAHFAGLQLEILSTYTSSSFSLRLPLIAPLVVQNFKMAKDKSEKKHKKSKEVTEEVTESIVPVGGDVEMGEAEVAKVSRLLQ